MIPEVAILDTWILLNLSLAIRLLPDKLWLRWRRVLLALMLYVALETVAHRLMEDAVAAVLVLL